MPNNLFNAEFSINKRTIGSNHSPYVIAELSGNHQGDIQRALQLIDAAAASGVDAIKIQTYRPDTITLDHNGPEFCLTDGLWQGRTLFELYQEAHTPWEWHSELFKRAQQHNITLFSSPFDPTAIDLLEDLNCPAYKIASFEITDIALLKYAASTGKPIIMSTGMATKAEIAEAAQAVYDGGGRDLAILHCVSGYPAPLSDCNLQTITDLTRQYNLPIGLSDHSLTNATAITAVALGARIIEKHFTLHENDNSVDAKFSLSPAQFSQLVTDIKDTWSVLGRVDYKLKQSEQSNHAFRRSLYIAKDIKAGEKFTSQNIKSVRPGLGLHPRYLAHVLTCSANCDLNAGSALKTEYITDFSPANHVQGIS